MRCAFWFVSNRSSAIQASLGSIFDVQCFNFAIATTVAITYSRPMRLISRMLFALPLLCATSLLADDWPQWLGPNRDSIWRESGIVEKFPTNGPPVLWRIAIGAGYSGPSVSQERFYVTDRQLAQGANNPADPFARGIIKGIERVLCLNEADGKLIWKHQYDCPYTVSYPAGPRVAPRVAAGKVYILGADVNLFCLDAPD